MHTQRFGIFRGTVVSSSDPLTAGRLLLQVPSITGFQKTTWAEASHPSGFPAVLPKAGEPVWVMFEGGDTDRPIWMGIPLAAGLAAGRTAVISENLQVDGTFKASSTSTFVGAVTGGVSSWTQITVGGNTFGTDATMTNVTVTGAMSVTGSSSFTNAPSVPASSWPISATNGLQAALDSKYGGSNPPPAPGQPGGGPVPANMVTTDTAQTITGLKTFSPGGYGNTPVTLSANAVRQVWTDGTHTGYIALATSSNDWMTGPAAGDLIYYSSTRHYFNSNVTAPNLVYGVTASGNLASSGGQSPAISMSATPTFTSATVPTLTGPVNTTGNLSENGARVYSSSNANLASTVTSETSYGLATAVGTGTAFARSDHTHGTPAAPTPASIGAASDTAVVHLAGTETITGAKTFSASLTANGVVTTSGYLVSGSAGTAGVLHLQPSNDVDGGWATLQVRRTSLWGDGITTTPSETAGTLYATMGAVNGASGIMLAAPHVVNVDSTAAGAFMRFGRAGGVSSGAYWDIGTRPNGTFGIHNTNGTNGSDLFRFAASGSTFTAGTLTITGAGRTYFSNPTASGSPRFQQNPSAPDTSYENTAIQIALDGNADTTRYPRIGFHLYGFVASQIGMARDGSIRVLNNPGTGYETLRAGSIYSNDVLLTPGMKINQTIRGSMAYNASATIPSVNLANTQLRASGAGYFNYNYPVTVVITAYMANATTVTATYGGAAATNGTAYYDITEWI